MTPTLNIDKSNWKKYRFDEFAQNVSERVEPAQTDLDLYVGLEHIDPDCLHLSRHGHPSDVEGTKLRFYAGDVIFGRRRAYQRKTALATQDGICSAHAMVLRAKENIVDSRFFPFLFHSKQFIDMAITISVGGLSPTINWKDIAKQEFLLPPLAEQQRLAELLWAADEMIEKEKRELEGVERMLQTYLDEFNAKHKPNAKLGDCLIVKKTKSKAPHRIEKYVGLEHIESGQRTTEKYDSSENVLADSYIFQKGDLLYSKLRPYLDKCIIADFDGICTTELIVYDTKDNASKEYILNILHSKSFLNYIVDKGFGTKMPRVSHEIVSNYDFYLPLESEQKELLGFIDEINNCAIDIKSQIAKSQEVKQEIINQIF
ncbi:MAG: restriction endonuclease subunit S [bacterium]|nr:restriction endonuclease subunit S [Candidatus Limimorpha equi]